MVEKILVFIPAYNCEKQIGRVLDQFDTESLEYISRIIVVNNRSTDETEQAIINYMDKHKKLPVELIRNDDNYGLGGSHKVAFSYAQKENFDYIIVLHGDDQGNIKDIIRYIKKGKHRKYDSFLGSRFDKNSQLINYSKIRIFGNHVFNFLVSILTRRRLTDLGSGLNMYHVPYLKSKFYLNFSDGLGFNVYLLLYGVYSKSDFTFFPLSWREEDQISNAKFVKQSLEMLKLFGQYAFDKKGLFDNQKNVSNSKEYTYQIICSNIKEEEK